MSGGCTHQAICANADFDPRLTQRHAAALPGVNLLIYISWELNRNRPVPILMTKVMEFPGAAFAGFDDFMTKSASDS